MRIIQPLSIAMIAMAAVLSSCKMDKDYDLSKKIDSEATILPGLSVPYDRSATLTLDDFLDLDKESDIGTFGKTDKGIFRSGAMTAGDYYFHFKGSKHSIYKFVDELFTGTETMEDYTFAISDVPEDLKAGNLILSNPSIQLFYENDYSVDLDVAATISANGRDIRIEELVVPQRSSGCIIISAKGGYALSGETEKVVPELSSIISPIPDEIHLTDISVTAINESYSSDIGIYRFSVTPIIVVPLCFDKGSTVSTNIEFSELGFDSDDLDMDNDVIDSFSILFAADNRIPLDFSFETKKGIDIDIPKIAASTSTDGEISAILGDSLKNLERTLMKITASVSGEPAQLNESQSLIVKMKGVRFPNGIKTDL